MGTPAPSEALLEALRMYQALVRAEKDYNDLMIATGQAFNALSDDDKLAYFAEIRKDHAQRQ